MKKQLTHVLIGLSVLGVGVVAVNAQTTVPPMPPTIPQGAPAAPGGAATAATTTMMPVLTKKAKLQNAVTKLEGSFMVRISNLDGLAARIQTRIGKLQQGGKDMTVASVKLAEAQKLIAEAKTELANLKKADTAMVASAKPATAFAAIKNKTAKNVVVKIKAAHKALVDTIVIMKGQGGVATTTPAVR